MPSLFHPPPDPVSNPAWWEGIAAVVATLFGGTGLLAIAVRELFAGRKQRQDELRSIREAQSKEIKALRDQLAAQQARAAQQLQHDLDETITRLEDTEAHLTEADDERRKLALTLINVQQQQALMRHDNERLNNHLYALHLYVEELHRIAEALYPQEWAGILGTIKVPRPQWITVTPQLVEGTATATTEKGPDDDTADQSP